MRLRAIGAVAVAVLAIGGLSSCRTNVGTAARVGGKHISESKVDGYVSPSGVNAAAAARLKQQGQKIPAARVVVLQILIDEQLYENVYAKRGGAPNAGRLAGYHDQLAQGLTGKALERAVATFLGGAGVTKDFTSTYVRFLELRADLASRSGVKSLAAFNKLVRTSGGSVHVNPRYGAWDAATLSLSSNASAGRPAYLDLQPSPAAGT